MAEGAAVYAEISDINTSTQSTALPDYPNEGLTPSSLLDGETKYEGKEEGKKLHKIKSLEDDDCFAIPEWCNVHFTAESYTQIAWKDHSYRKKSLNSGRSPNGTGVAENGVGSNNNNQEEVEEEEEHAHLLHETLIEYGGLKNLSYFIDSENKHLITVCHLGSRICGHKGIVHGGFTATLFDNSLGYLAFKFCQRPATKSLFVEYKKPLLCGQTVLVSCTVEGKENEKDWRLSSVLYGSEGKVIAKATGIFVDVSKIWKCV